MCGALLLENIEPVAEGCCSRPVRRRTAGGERSTRPTWPLPWTAVDLLGLRSKTQVTADGGRNPGLAGVGAFCIDTTRFDLGAAAAAGVAVFNAPYFNTRGVVELAIAEIISLARRLSDRDRALRAGI
jgi:D-3-phosphoglycerate dehydrogenase